MLASIEWSSIERWLAYHHILNVMVIKMDMVLVGLARVRRAVGELFFRHGVVVVVDAGHTVPATSLTDDETSAEASALAFWKLGRRGLTDEADQHSRRRLAGAPRRSAGQAALLSCWSFVTQGPAASRSDATEDGVRKWMARGISSWGSDTLLYRTMAEFVAAFWPRRLRIRASSSRPADGGQGV